MDETFYASEYIKTKKIYEKIEQIVVLKCGGPKSIRPKLFWDEGGTGSKYSQGRSVLWAKAVSGPNWM